MTDQSDEDTELTLNLDQDPDQIRAEAEHLLADNGPACQPVE